MIWRPTCFLFVSSKTPTKGFLGQSLVKIVYICCFAFVWTQQSLSNELNSEQPWSRSDCKAKFKGPNLFQSPWKCSICAHFPTNFGPFGSWEFSQTLLGMMKFDLCPYLWTTCLNMWSFFVSRGPTIPCQMNLSHFFATLKLILPPLRASPTFKTS